MQLSRSHAGMLAVVSIFTGIIAPVGTYLGQETPLPLTNMQWISYAMLGLLIVIFYLVSLWYWKHMRLISFVLIVLILSVFYLWVTDSIINLRTGFILTSLSWGWIFFIAGGILLIWSIFFEYEEYAPISNLSDKIVWLIWSITLLVLSVVIFMVSVVLPEWERDRSIVRNIFGSGDSITQSGIIISPPFDSIENLSFERKNDTLIFEGNRKDIDKKFHRTFLLGNRRVIIEDEGVIIDGKSQTWKLIKLFDDDLSLVIQKEDTSLHFITPFAEKTYSGENARNPEYITKDTSSKTLAWANKSNSWYALIKNGQQVWRFLSSITHIALSTSGYDIMAYGTTQSGTQVILKNGDIWETLRENINTGSYRSNGSHSLYVIGKPGEYRVIYDGSLVNWVYEEVRETFLEKSGNSYVYFARPLWEKRYCLFTRYRGNICSLDGYMNPRLSADGGSILFAGLRDNVWSIYRNTGIVVQDTHYTKRNIWDDYVFFDITNPRQYLFIEKQEDGWYMLRKNWKLVEWRWNDVWLDVAFGYDNKMIMSVEDALWWRIIEL